MKAFTLLLIVALLSSCAETEASEDKPAKTDNDMDTVVNAVDTMSVDSSDVVLSETQNSQTLEDAFILTIDPWPYEEGSGDWGFFVYDVGRYAEWHGIPMGGSILEQYDSIEVTTDEGIRYFDLTPFLEYDARGYVLFYGDESTFLNHDMPGSIIAGINEFFGTEGSLQDVPNE